MGQAFDHYRVLRFDRLDFQPTELPSTELSQCDDLRFYGGTILFSHPTLDFRNSIVGY
jgi:hypothetical protein